MIDWVHYLIGFLVAFMVVSVGAFLYYNVASVQAEITANAEWLGVLDSTIVMEACLKNNDKYIDIDDINAVSSSTIDFFCRSKYSLSHISGAKIVDLEPNQQEDNPQEEWIMGAFSDDFSGKTHSIFVNLKIEDEIHVGKLYTQI